MAAQTNRNRGPPSSHSPKRGETSTHFLIDKQQALVVLWHYVERYTIRPDDELQTLRYRLPALWKAPQRPSAVPLPELHEDVHREP